jgi:hypothetical protein
MFMTRTLITALTLMAGSAAGADIDAAQFHRLMDGLHADVRDVTLVYEGDHGPVPGDPEGEMGGKFQGLYSIRSDGATLMDVFLRSHRVDRPVSRTIKLVLGGRLEGVSQLPDLGRLIPETSAAPPGALNETASVERILYLWYFATLDDPARMGYQFLGWEEVDGHRCLNVQLYEVPAAGLEKVEQKPTVVFWIDVERGGHPLKVEFRAGSEVRMRAEKIRLGQVPRPDGPLVWLPVSGELNTTLDLGRGKSTPYRETYVVVDGSVRLNQSLGDAYFRLKTNRELPAVGKLRDYQKLLGERAPIRTDPAGVKERLDRQLAEANRQAEQLVASSSAREPGDWTSLLAPALGALGVGLIGTVAYLKWRGA